MPDRLICTCMLMSSSTASELEHLNYAIQQKDNDDIDETTIRINKMFGLMNEYCGIDTYNLITKTFAVQTLSIEGEYNLALNLLVELRMDYDEVLDKC